MKKTGMPNERELKFQGYDKKFRAIADVVKKNRCKHMLKESSNEVWKWNACTLCKKVIGRAVKVNPEKKNIT